VAAVGHAVDDAALGDGVVGVRAVAAIGAREAQAPHGGRAETEVVADDVALQDELGAQPVRRVEEAGRVVVDPVELQALGRGEQLEEHALQVGRGREAGIAARTVPVVVGAGAAAEAEVGAVRDQRQAGDVAALVLALEIGGGEPLGARAGGHEGQDEGQERRQAERGPGRPARRHDRTVAGVGDGRMSSGAIATLAAVDRTGYGRPMRERTQP
jgi:hypothetical protein